MKEASRERYQRIDRICLDLIEMEPQARQKALDDLSTEDEEVHQEVLLMLDIVAKSVEEEFLDAPAVDDAARAIKVKGGLPPEPMPKQVGPYPIIECIGQGGMGSVYKALQDSPERVVALKIISPTNRKEFLERFHYEYQALARMNSPYIAQVFDAGLTKDGRPFFTMELVEGAPIIQYCDERKLSLGRRLALFIRICEGVRHAHSRGLIHRDLKPTNILIIEDDNRQPIPKIIDFGIAKAMGRSAVHATVMGMLVGTPAYMSPEQAHGEDIDTAADVYALGMILYELLCGFLPMSEEVYESTPGKLLKILEDFEAPKITTRYAGESAENQTIVAENRNTTPTGLYRALRSDLQNIVMKAIEKKRGNRYGSVIELTEDIRRYREHKPVKARHAGFFYQLQKFLRRNTASVTTSIVFLFLLVFITIRWIDLLQQQKKAVEEVQEYSELFLDLLPVNDPRRNIKSDMDDVARKLDLATLSPISKARFHMRLGNVYSSRDYTEEAFDQFNKAKAILDHHKNSDDLSKVIKFEANYNLAHGYLRKSDHTKAKEIFQNIIQTFDFDKENYYRILKTKSMLAETLEAMECERQAIHLLEETLFDQIEYLESDEIVNSDVLQEHDEKRMNEALLTITNYSEVISSKKELAAFWAFTAMEYRSRYFAPSNSNTQYPAFKLALIYRLDSDYADMVQYYLEHTLRNWRKVYGLEHRDTMAATNNLGRFYTRKGMADKAVALFEETLDSIGIYIHKGEKRTNWLSMLNNYAEALIAQKRYEEALAIKKKEQTYRAVHFDDIDQYYFQMTTGEIYEAIGQSKQAGAIYLDSFTHLSTIYRGTNKMRVITAADLLLGNYHKQGRCNEAVVLVEPMLEAYMNADYKTAVYFDDPKPLGAFTGIVAQMAKCLEEGNQPQEAARIRRMYTHPEPQQPQ